MRKIKNKGLVEPVIIVGATISTGAAVHAGGVLVHTAFGEFWLFVWAGTFDMDIVNFAYFS